MSNDATQPKNTYNYTVPKQREDIVTDTEKFNSLSLKEAAGRLDSSFSQFASILMEANDLVNSRVNASCDECVFGAYGNQLLEMWNSNVPTFSEFKANFEAWSRAVSVIATRDENTEAIATAIYNNRATGADLTTATGQSVSEMREDIILSTAKVDQNNNSGGGKTYRYYDENGVLTTRYENAEGEVWMQHSSDNNGNLVTTVCTDSEGNTSKIEFVRDADGNLVEKKVTFYDKDGKELETAPDTFKDTGYLKDAKAGNDGYNPDGTPIETEDTTGTEGGWTSYKDAAADGASNILTESEFARRNGENGYTCTDANGNSVTVDNYQDYLDVMYEKYGPGSAAASTVGATETGAAATTGADSFIAEYGAPDGSSEWQEAFQQLSTEDQQAVLAANAGNVNDSLGTNYGLTSEVPANGEYDGRNIVVPELTENDFNGLSNDEQVDLKNVNAQSIVDSAYAVQTNIDSEASSLTTLKTNLENNESYKALPAETQAEIQTYLQGQIDARTTLSSNITEECKSGVGTVDGTIGDATTYIYNVESGFLGTGSHFEDYNEAVQTAKSWNETLSSMDDVNYITGYLNSHGVFF